MAPPTKLCGRGLIPRLGVICGLSLLLLLILAPRGFSPGSPVFPSLQKPSFPYSNLTWNLRVTGLSVVINYKMIMNKCFVYSGNALSYPKLVHRHSTQK